MKGTCSLKLFPVFFLLMLLMMKQMIFSNSFMGLDKLSFYMLMVSFLVISISFSSKTNTYNGSNKLFWLVLFLLFFIVMSYFLMSKFIWLYFFFELSIIPIFFMVSGWGYQLERVQASYYLLLYTAFFSFPFYFLLCSIWMTSIYTKSTGVFNLIFFIIFLSLFLVKCPIYFFHLWLPKAHVESPVMGSIILAGVLLKLGGYGLLRVFFISLTSVENFTLFVLLTSLGSVMASFVSFFQTDQKSIIAYASVGHMSVICCSVFCLVLIGFKVGVSLMLFHGIVSSLMFFLSYIYFMTTNNRMIFLNQGSGFWFSSALFFFTLLNLINFSVPPFPTFFSEILILLSFLSISIYMSFLIMLILFLGCCFSIFLVVNSIHGKFFSISSFNNFSYFYSMFTLYMSLVILMLFCLKSVC